MRLRPRSEPEPPHEVKFRVAAETYDELDLYCQLSAEEYGHEIDVPTPAAEILQQFLAIRDAVSLACQAATNLPLLLLPG